MTTEQATVRHYLTHGEHSIHVILITVPIPLRSSLIAKIARAAIHGRTLQSIP
jgi:hypothetical protein